jgi:hypothetical protein
LRGEGADVYLFYNKKITTLHQIELQHRITYSREPSKP